MPALFPRPAAAAACAVFLTAALALPGQPAWIAAAAACHFCVKAAGRRQVFFMLPMFALLAAFAWGVLLICALLFAALLAEIWSGGAGRFKQGASLLAAGLCLAALLFVCVPGISLYADAFSIPPLAPALVAAAIALLEFAALKKSPAPAAADPLLIILLTALTLCYALTVALLAVSIAYPQAILLAAAGGCILLTAGVILTAPFMRGGTMTALQHIFALHVPIEKWVADISADAARENSAAAFAAAVMQRFLSLPGVAGVSWRLNDGEERAAGRRGREHLDLQCPPLFARLYMRRRASPWDWFNYYLLARISGEYCLAKQREEQRRADALSRAVHQTGARLTHDIKNILHTIAALTQSNNDALIKKQLPALYERLESTLRKLQAPDAGEEERLTDINLWWQTAGGRYRHQPVEFAAAATAAGEAPAALFDLALDNFIGNALIKRQTDDALVIRARLLTINGKPALQVEDSGAAVAPGIAAALFQQPVESATGFGIALYQVQLEAQKHGYRAALAANADGKVVFQLAAAA